MSTALEDIQKERDSQDARWGQQNHDPLTWLAILGEEVGEVNKAALEATFGSIYNGSWDDYRTELVQVAAVAIAMIESFDRNGEPDASLNKS